MRDFHTVVPDRFNARIAMTPAAARLHDVHGVLAPERECPIDLTLFISCYNESEYVIATIETVRSALAEVRNISYEIIVVDDCSVDHSPDLVEKYISDNPDERILLRRNGRNRGLAQNYIDAAFIGKGKYYRLICGDNAEPKDTMVAIFRRLGDADLVVPYYTSAVGKSLYRRLLSRAYTWIVNRISGLSLHYYNGLAVHLRYNVMRWHPSTRGFGFQADIICMLLDQGFSYIEIPVRTVERKGPGSSRALTFKNVLSVSHTLVGLVVRRISRWVYRN